MNEARAGYGQLLAAQIEALHHLVLHPDPPDQERTASLKRIAKAVQPLGEAFGYPEISRASERLLRSRGGKVVDRAKELLETVRRAADGLRDAKLRVLVVDDEATHREFLKKALTTPERVILEAESAADLRDALKSGDVFLILLDLVLPDGDGRNILWELRHSPETSHIPVVVVSAKGTSQPRSECLALGAEAYFEKPVDVTALRTVVDASIRRVAESGRHSRVDPVTGMPNRGVLAERYETARKQDAVSLALVTPDGFDALIERYGEERGDMILKQVAELLSDSLRPSDTVSRWKDDEFVILLPRLTKSAAAARLEKVQARISAAQAVEIDSKRIPVTFSAGVVELRESETIDQAVLRARARLSAAQSEGPASLSHQDTSDSTTSRTVLLAEDDRVTAKLVEHRLRRQDLEVLHYENGRLALEAAREKDISLFVLDVQMPGASGFEVLRELRTLPQHSETPVLMLTSMGSDDDIVRGFRLGADDYLTKPFSPTELMARIGRLLDRKGARSSSD